MLDSLLAKEDLPLALSARKSSPGVISQSFRCAFRPLFEVQEPLNRLAGRKLAQQYAGALIAVAKQCNSELSKAISDEWLDATVALMHQSIQLLSKIEAHISDESLDTMKLYSCLLSRCTEKKLVSITQFERVVEISTPLVKLAELGEERGKEALFLRMNLMVARANALLQSGVKTQDSLEEVRSLLAEKCEACILCLCKHVLSSVDHAAISKLYINIFRLLFHCGKSQDSVASGDLEIHSEALATRHRALAYLAKTKPNLQDFFAFAYASVQATYRVASSHQSLKLFQALAISIRDCFDMTAYETYPFYMDKNCCALVEIVVFSLQKLQKYEEAKHAIRRVIVTASVHSRAVLLQTAKFWLYHGRLTHLLGGKPCKELTEANSCMESAAEIGGNMDENTEKSRKYLCLELDNWLKLLFNLLSASTLDSGDMTDTELLGTLQKLLINYERIGEIADKSLFFYLRTALELVLFLQTRDGAHHSGALSSLRSLFATDCIRFLSSIYNITLVLLHRGDQAVAYDVLGDTVRYLSRAEEKCTSVHLCLFDLWSRHIVLSWEAVTQAQELLLVYIRAQVRLCSLHELPCDSWEKLVAISHRLNRTLTESCDAPCDYKAEDGLLVVQLDCQLHCLEQRMTLAQKELANCKRSLVRSAHWKPTVASRYRAQIETLVLYLERLLRSGGRRQLARVILEYIEVVAACPTVFPEESVLRSLFGLTGTSAEALCSAVEKVIELEPIPDAFVWKSVLLLERVKKCESQYAQSPWVCDRCASLYVPAVTALQSALSGWAGLLQCTVDFAPNCYSLLRPKRRPELTQAEVSETIRSLMLCADVCSLLELHKMAAIAYELVNKLLKFQPRDGDFALRKTLTKLRLSLSLYYAGFTALSEDACKVANLYESDFSAADSHTSEFLHSVWTETLQAERLLLTCDFLPCVRKCEHVLKASENCAKKDQMVRAKCCWILAYERMLQGDYRKAVEWCGEGKRILQEPSSAMSLQNLSLLASIKDNCYLKIRERDSVQSGQVALFPWSSWSHQQLSLSLVTLLAEVYLAQGFVLSAFSLHSSAGRLGRLIGSPAVILAFLTKKIALERQMQPDVRLDCGNITQEKGPEMDSARQFLSAVSKSLFGTVLAAAKKQLAGGIVFASELIQIADESLLVLSPSDLSALGHFLPISRLVQTLIAVGELTISSEFADMLEPLHLSDQNFFKLAKSVLLPVYQGVFFQSLRSVIYKRQAAMMARKRKSRECLSLLVRSALELGCCEDFFTALVTGRRCCSEFQLNPHWMDELALSSVIYADLMLKQRREEEAYSLLRGVSSVLGVRCVSAQRQIGYLLGRNPHSDAWTRSFFAMKSIGVTYTLQSKSPSPLSTSSLDEFTRCCSKIARKWTVVGLSIGRGVLSEGLLLTRLCGDQSPVTFTLSSKCENCSKSPCLSDLLEDFARIMRESAQTIGTKMSANKWWQTREALDGRLDDWLTTVQSSLFGPLSCLLLGRVREEEIERVIESESRDFCEKRSCPDCGQTWDSGIIYCLLSAVATNSLSSDEIKALVDSSGLNKALVMKKVRSVRKEVASRAISRHPVVLVVDGSLLYIPWESLPVLASQVVTRTPSFQFLIDRLSLPPWTLSSAYYVLNPSKDLESTQATFQPYLQGRENWEGQVAVPPSESDMKTALERKDLVLYCGHSSGEQYIKGEVVRDCSIRAVTLLIGCSSGMLRPVGQYEPQGIAIQYLLGGCPALVANLWDVTDKDIDRFAMELLRRLSVSEELSSAVSQSRHVCKLKRLIGAAPVVYGVPLTQLVKG